jgi:hypothetical protein
MMLMRKMVSHTLRRTQSLLHSRNCLCFLIASLSFLPIRLLFLIHSFGGRARRGEQPALRWMILALSEEAPPMPALASGPRMSLPKLELPAFKGEKGAKAQIWLEILGRFQKFYRMTDEQAVELARFSCKGPYAKAWAGLLPDDLTLKTFKEHFEAEFAVENQDKLMSELLEKVKRMVLVNMLQK